MDESENTLQIDLKLQKIEDVWQSKRGSLVIYSKKYHNVLYNVPDADQEDMINDLANEMADWVVNKNIYNLESFPLMKKYSPTKFFKLADINDYFSTAIDYCKYVIAVRIQDDWRLKKIEREYAKSMLPLYHQGYYNFTLARTLVSSQGANEGHNRQFVILEKFPESNCVPNKE